MTRLSLAAVLAEPARRTPDQLALVQGDLRVTYADLWRQARGHAAALQAKGIRPGDRVALLAPNVADFVRASYGILAAGGLVVPVPTLLNAAEAAYILQHSGAGSLLYDASFAAIAAPAAEMAQVPAWDIAALGAEEREPLRTHVAREAEDVAVVFYTSGTTGRPKGALLTHLNLVLNSTVNAFDGNQLLRDDVVMGCLPVFHTFGQTVSMNSTFRVGATMLLQPRFDPDAAIEMMRRERATLFFGVPTMFAQLFEAAARADVLPQLRDCVSGGASLPVVVLDRFEKTFGTTVYEGYGLSETSPTASVNQPWFGTKPGTVGHPVCGVEVEEVCAVVAPAPGENGPVSAEELGAWSREQLGGHKYPRRVELLDALPMGPSHKILERELRTLFAGVPA
jgi:long-chain acyl-CoA synthetase